MGTEKCFRSERRAHPAEGQAGDLSGGKRCVLEIMGGDRNASRGNIPCGCRVTPEYRLLPLKSVQSAAFTHVIRSFSCPRMRPHTLRSPRLLRRETPRKRCPGGREDARGAVCYTAPPGAPSPDKLRQTYSRDASHCEGQEMVNSRQQKLVAPLDAIWPMVGPALRHLLLRGGPQAEG